MYVTSVDHIINKGSVWVIDTNTNTVVGPPIGVPIISAGIAFDPTHNRMYIDSLVGTVLFIDTNTNTVGPSILVGPRSNGIAFDPSHNRLYVTIYDPITNNGGVSVIDTNTNTVVG